MATSKDREYKNVPLEEQDAVELRKAVATGSVKEPVLSSASALIALRRCDVLLLSHFLTNC